ncbi:MAG: ParB/RepB/Spo0J family partition protein [Oscillospiraceae bacterium]|nr:ParB/RepB/Spo0J family partition protein [Oscillospiraceae bacterium]
MKSSARKVELASVDDLFSTEESRQDAALERVQNIPLAELHPFPDHPFSVRDDEIMQETVDSVKERGVLIPAIARPRDEGGYEIVAGHRRKRACELVGLETMPVIVRDLDRDAAIIIMVDTNIQRENISPIEKAKALKMKLEAIKRQGARTDLTSTQVAQKLSVERVGDEAGISKDQVRR